MHTAGVLQRADTLLSEESVHQPDVLIYIRLRLHIRMIAFPDVAITDHAALTACYYDANR
ncbi:hypothetical protein ABO04_06320 [Nitrosomonas sp. HPC101]|nr:hypothetical protein [Nitrosomonas sp. HPC101]